MLCNVRDADHYMFYGVEIDLNICLICRGGINIRNM